MTVSMSGLRREARLWRQPGPVHHDRFVIRSESGATSSRATLAPGKTLVEAIAGIVERSEGGAHKSAAIVLIAGHLERCDFCLADRDRSGRTVATYTPMKTWLDVQVIDGSATFGRSVNKDLLVHCHAWFSDLQGNVGGGHLDPNNSIVGRNGLIVRVTQFSGIELQQTPDAETNHAVFMPVSTPNAAA